MAKRILDKLVIGNALISTKKEHMTKEQIEEYWRIVDALLPDNYYTSGNNNSIENFCEEYSFLVKRINNEVIIDCDIAKLERYCRMGIPTEVVNIFDLAGTQLNEIESQLINNPKNNNEQIAQIDETFRRNNLIDKSCVLKKIRNLCTK